MGCEPTRQVTGGTRVADLSEEPDPTSFGVFTNLSDGESWDLDLVGNWKWKKEGPADEETDTFASANPLNQYPSVTPHGQTTRPFTFDWLGQLREDDSKSRTYAWDRFGRLTRVYENGTLAATYRYDALNRRVEKKVMSGFVATDGTTRFIYDGWRAIEDRAVIAGPPDSEVVRARYGFGLALDEVAWMDRDLAICPTGQPSCTAGQPDPVFGIPNGTIESRFFLHQDGLGSVAAMTDDPASGNPSTVERFTYEAYGEASAWQGTWSSTDKRYGNGISTPRSRFGLPYLYTGQRLDAETGLFYYKNRFFDAQSGRFLRRDPLGYSEGPSLYQYAASNPATFIDPLGLVNPSNSEPPPGQQNWECADCDSSQQFGMSMGAGFVPTYSMKRRGGTWTATAHVVWSDPLESPTVTWSDPVYTLDGPFEGPVDLANTSPATQFDVDIYVQREWSAAASAKLLKQAGYVQNAQGEWIAPSAQLLNHPKDFRVSLAYNITGTTPVGLMRGYPREPGLHPVIGDEELEAMWDLYGLWPGRAAFRGGWWGVTKVLGLRTLGRELDDIIKDPKLFKRWLKHKHPVDKPLSADDAKKVWDKASEMSMDPTHHTGHPGQVWKDPHLNVGGSHIPVDAAFTPPRP